MVINTINKPIFVLDFNPPLRRY